MTRNASNLKPRREFLRLGAFTGRQRSREREWQPQWNKMPVHKQRPSPLKSARPVVLDACVLIPMPLADTLLRLAAGPHLFLPKWSDQIMEEVTRTLQENFGLSPQKAMYRESEMRRHFHEAWIDNYEDLIPR